MKDLSHYERLLGSAVAERFRLTRLISVGGMGAVFHAEDLKLGGACALKILREDLRQHPEFYRRFLREARAASHVGHPNIIRIIDIGELGDGIPFLAMEYLEGCDLGQLVREHGPLAWRHLAPMMIQVCRALQAAHSRGIIHRDIKPSNIMLLGEWPSSFSIVKVIDFGIVMLDESAALQTLADTTVGHLGTLPYMAPELLAGLARASPATDVYSLGVTMYAILTGALPRPEGGEVPPPSTRATDPHAALADALVLKAMSYDAKRRFPDMSSLERAIAQTLEAHPTTTTAPSPRPPPPSARIESFAQQSAPLTTFKPDQDSVDASDPPSADDLPDPPNASSRRQPRGTWIAALLAGGITLFAGVNLIATERFSQDDPPNVLATHALDGTTTQATDPTTGPAEVQATPQESTSTTAHQPETLSGTSTHGDSDTDQEPTTSTGGEPHSTPQCDLAAEKAQLTRTLATLKPRLVKIASPHHIPGQTIGLEINITRHQRPTCRLDLPSVEYGSKLCAIVLKRIELFSFTCSHHRRFIFTTVQQ